MYLIQEQSLEASFYCLELSLLLSAGLDPTTMRAGLYCINPGTQPRFPWASRKDSRGLGKENSLLSAQSSPQGLEQCLFCCLWLPKCSRTHGNLIFALCMPVSVFVSLGLCKELSGVLQLPNHRFCEHPSTHTLTPLPALPQQGKAACVLCAALKSQVFFQEVLRWPSIHLLPAGPARPLSVSSAAG